jgi:MerR family transcriptional regulator/heat shock protein HspR
MTRGNSRSGGLTVREVSEMTGVPAHTLRFWEKGFHEFLRPSRTSGGQRRYSRSDVQIIRRIRRFRYVGKRTVAGTIDELNREPHRRRAIDRMVDEIARLIKRRLLGRTGGGG